MRKVKVLSAIGLLVCVYLMGWWGCQLWGPRPVAVILETPPAPSLGIETIVQAEVWDSQRAAYVSSDELRKYVQSIPTEWQYADCPQPGQLSGPCLDRIRTVCVAK